MKKDPTPRPLAERFWEKVDKAPGHGPHGECWVWTASTNTNGYGQLSTQWKRRPAAAHHVAFELAYGHPPKDTLRHSCDYPPCVRPDHLIDGTQADNLADMRIKGRGKLPPVLRGEKSFRHKLEWAQVLEIRRRYADGDLSRVLARDFGVNRSSIISIVSRRNWSHV